MEPKSREEMSELTSVGFVGEKDSDFGFCLVKGTALALLISRTNKYLRLGHWYGKLDVTYL